MFLTLIQHRPYLPITGSSFPLSHHYYIIYMTHICGQVFVLQPLQFCSSTCVISLHFISSVIICAVVPVVLCLQTV
ncbi:hypothetical protein EDD16DRAFT_1656981 [Pisolithus croceorrhizus]|nr:hypothetical protein EDD16DRAFT_1656981 [Pisolithus croceorrhizus]KAI6166490.1 hypothetical protein EDD17DRAFT_1543564 [Pisolithus thermaeus]